MQRARPASAEWLGLFLAYSVLTCVFTFPQVFRLSSHTGAHYDALFGIWRLAWFAHQLKTDPQHLFDANIFHPELNTLAYSDAVPLLGLLAAPLLWVGISAPIVYNLLVLLAFPTSAIAMYALAGNLTRSRVAAFLAGMIFAFQPYRIAHLPQIELLWTCWIPLALLALHRLVDAPTLRRSVALGACVALQAWSCLYYVVYLATALVLLTPLLLVQAHPRISRFIRAAGVAVVVAVAACLPYASAYASSNEALRERGAQEVAQWSPTLQNYIATNHGSNLFYQPPVRVGHVEGVLFPGFVAIALTLCAFVVPRINARITYIVLLIVAFDLSLGVNGFMYETLASALPLYQSLRVPGRMFVMVSCAMSVLAAFCATWMFGKLRRQLFRYALASVLAAAILAEGMALPVSLEALPHGPWRIYEFVAALPRTVLLEWPLPRPDALGVTREPVWMYFSTTHWQPLVNGYSGRYPTSYIDIIHRMLDFPSTASLGHLRQRGVRYVIVHDDAIDPRYEEVVNRLSTIDEAELVLTERWSGGRAALIRLLK